MIPYSLRKRTVNANLVAINQAKSRIQAALAAGEEPNPTDLALVAEERSRYFAVAQITDKVTLDDLARHIADHRSSFPRGEIQAIVSEVVDCIREHLLEGKKVSLGDLGDFSLKIVSEGVDEPAEFTDRHISDVKAVWSCGSELQNLKTDAEFRQVPPRKMQREALKNEINKH